MFAAAVPVIVAGLVGAVPPTPPPGAPDTSFLRGLAEQQLATTRPDLIEVACAPPPVDEPGVSFPCYGNASGVLTRFLITMNDDGGLEVAEAPLSPAPPPAPTEPLVFEGVGSTFVSTEPFAVPTLLLVTAEAPTTVSVQLGDEASPVGLPYGPGRHLLSGPDVVGGLHVTADGPWTVTVEPIEQATPLVGDVSGTGSDVLALDAAAGSVDELRFTASGPVAVTAVTGTTRQAMFVLTAPTGGSTTAALSDPAPEFIVVTAESGVTWTATIGAATESTAIG